MRSSSFPNRRFLTVAACVCAVGGGAFLFAQTRRDADPRGAGDGKPAYLETIQPVAAERAAPRSGVRKQAVLAVSRPVTLRLTGSLTADEKSDVGCNVGAMVLKTHIERGSVVKKGDLLVELDPRDYQNALDEGQCAAEELRVRLGLDETAEFDVNKVPEVESAKLAMQLAESNYRRSEQLRKKNAIAAGDAEQFETDYRACVQRYRLAVLTAKQMYRSYRSALTHLVTLRKAVDDCYIRAPYDGWITERCVSEGEHVIAIFPGAKLATMIRIDPLRLSLTVPEQEMAAIKAGEAVAFQTDAFPGKRFTGTVRYVTPAVTAESRSLCVEAVVPNPQALLRPGLFVTAELELDKRQTELYVPAAAVRGRGDVAAVFVVRGGVVREQIVSLGQPAAEGVRITSGLAAGEVVVTTPEQVHDGDPE
jgi:membrane fusion protein (multidrug efflux system)